MHQGRQPLGVAVRLLAGVGRVKQGAGGAHLHAFAAVGAGAHRTPGLIQAADDLAVLAPPAHIPHMGTLHLVADPHAAGAEDAAVVIEPKLPVGEIHSALGKAIRQAAVIHAYLHRQVLQLAVAVGHADGAHVVAFGEQQFDHRAPDLLQLWRLGAHLHAFAGSGDAGGQQTRFCMPIGSAHFHQAQPAGGHG